MKISTLRICIHLSYTHTYIYAEISVCHTPLGWLIRTSEDLLNGCRKLYCITRLTDLFLRVPSLFIFPWHPFAFNILCNIFPPSLYIPFPILSQPFHVHATFDIIKGIKPTPPHPHFTP